MELKSGNLNHKPQTLGELKMGDIFEFFSTSKTYMILRENKNFVILEGPDRGMVTGIFSPGTPVRNVKERTTKPKSITLGDLNPRDTFRFVSNNERVCMITDGGNIFTFTGEFAGVICDIANPDCEVRDVNKYFVCGPADC